MEGLAMSGPNIHQQIEEVERELSKRPSVYQRMVDRGQMRRSEAEEMMARMRAALETLLWCRDNRELIAKTKSEISQ